MNHEKICKNGIFLGNSPSKHAIRPELAGLKTIRIGAVAYDIHGHKISPSYYVSLFLDKSELGEYGRIMGSIK